MKRIFTMTIALAALIAAGAGTILACPQVFVINFSGQFGLLDVSSGVFTPIGKGLPNTPDGIAGAPGGPFYTVDGSTGHLLRINRDGTVTDVGDTRTGPNVGPTGISLIGSLLDGTMYGLDFSNRLYKVNTNTGSLMPMQVLSLPAQETDYSGNMLTSLTGDGTNLYYTLEILEGKRKTGPTIFTIDPVKQTVTSKPLKGVRQAIGSGWINGGLYLFGAYGEIYKVNPATGDADVASKYDSSITPTDPPFTGIFGAVGTVEPYGAQPVSSTPKTETAKEGRHDWPARHWVRLPQ